MENQREEYRQAMHYFTQSMLRAGVGLALTPISALPKESQQYLKEASRDFTSGLTRLVHGFATTLDRMQNS